ncbi:PadR family transcriptional regulator [Nocardioides mesophilus]|uniref:PadR family transcriptional regulator n=1 Tax=Nocardioides mesophilus TaxID=433659 RepID=A0A7G9RFP4_9ACTN|nr:PadR family transcriptional regulator [Nocardioides mesophilus]QNN54419.1 PadR family transcriptional regulator [Nocardioides mesophilus]
MARRGETLELAVLGLLHESPMHGYELRKQLNGVLGWSRVLSYGSLYPALKKLVRAGWIAEDLSTAPVTASRRQRIVYALTSAGEDRFTMLMSEAGPSSWEDDSFDVRFAFFGRTDMEIRLRILEGRRARLEERLERVQGQLDKTQQQMDRYATELQRHGVESVQREVRWLSELINAERGTDGAVREVREVRADGADGAETDSITRPAAPQTSD